MERSKQSQLNEYARSVIRKKARQLIGKYGFTHDDREDLEQEMILDLLVRLPKFDPEKACLNTFVARIVDRKVSTMIRRQQAGSATTAGKPGPLDEPLRDSEGADRGETMSQDDFDLRVGSKTQPAAERIGPPGRPRPRRSPARPRTPPHSGASSHPHPWRRRHR